MANPPKLGRSYTLLVEKTVGDIRTPDFIGPINPTNFVTIALPFTIEFDILRNTLSSSNTVSIRIYNLNAQNRNAIRKDQIDIGVLRSVLLTAGYGANQSVIFKGDIQQAWSVRQGTDFITEIQAFDSGFAFVNAHTELTIPKGPTGNQKVVLQSLISQLPGVALGTIGGYSQVATRGSAYNGPTVELLRQQGGGGFFIDNGVANVLQDNECLDLPTLEITSASGLLGTPIREQYFLNFDMLFEPTVVVGQMVNLNSITGSGVNGPYKVVSIRHHGMISETICGSVITSLGLFNGLNDLIKVPKS